MPDPIYTILPGRIPYTRETEAHVVVVPYQPGDAKRLTLTATLGDKKLISGAKVDGRRKTAVAFPASKLRKGESRVRCVLRAAGRDVAESELTFRRLPHKPNVVKINHVGAGLIVEDLPLVPFGFYCGGDNPADMVRELIDEEAVQGFNQMMHYHERANTKAARAKITRYLDRCAEVGMKVMYPTYWIYWPRDRKMGPKQWDELRDEVEWISDHPALLGYYLADEPGPSKIPAEILDKSYQVIKAADPYHPVMLVHMNPDQAGPYHNCMDIVMVDPYLVPNHAIHKMSNWVKDLRKEFAGGVPMWIAPQAFGGVHWWDREPSWLEGRVLTYIALIHGATGIMYFINAPRPTTSYVSPNSPRLWNEYRGIALEAAELTPALLSAEPAPEIECRPKCVQAAAWRDRGVITILAANPTYRQRRLNVRVAGCDYTGEATVPFEFRSVKVVEGRISEMINAVGTRAYQIPVGPFPREDLREDRRNLVRLPSFETIPNPGNAAGFCTTHGTGRGATYFVDSRVARHGRHSLRLRAPAEEHVGIIPIRFAVEKGVRYRVSVWAKAAKAGVKLTLGLDHVKPARKHFTLTADWKEYTMTGRAPADREVAEVFLQIDGPGTAWFDMLQAVPL